jgi:hypothetical protein
MARRGLDAILVTASGCGTMIKDFGFLLRNEPAYAAKAARVSALAKDVTEFLGQLDQPEPINPQGTTVGLPLRLLDAAWPTDRRLAKAAPDASRLQRPRHPRRAFVLRLGRHLQYSGARDCHATARPQDRQHC